MRIFGAIAFLALMIWTWSLIHSDSPMETHAAIQEKMVAYIEQTVKKQKPNSTDFKVEKFWTESLQAGALKAHFIYSFVEKADGGESTTTRIQGSGDLSRKEVNGDEQTWVLNNITTSSDSLIFNEGTLITPETTSETPTQNQ